MTAGIEIRPPFNEANVFIRKGGNKQGKERIQKLLSKFHEEEKSSCMH